MNYERRIDKDGNTARTRIGFTESNYKYILDSAAANGCTVTAKVNQIVKEARLVAKGKENEARNK